MSKYQHPPVHIARREGVITALQMVMEIIGQAYVQESTGNERLLYVERSVRQAIEHNPPLSN